MPSNNRIELTGNLRALSDLPPSVRRLWEGASARVFDIGKKTTGRGRFTLALRQETVKTIARLDARVALPCTQT